MIATNLCVSLGYVLLLECQLTNRPSQMWALGLLNFVDEGKNLRTIK